MTTGTNVPHSGHAHGRRSTPTCLRIITACLLMVQLSCGGSSGSSDGGPGGPGIPGPGASTGDSVKQIARENARAGDSGWLLSNPSLNGEIAAYADRESYAAGTDVRIAVSANPPGPFQYEVFRMGGYRGMGARRYTRGGPLLGLRQADPSFDATTGLVVAGWPPTFSISTRGDGGEPWLTGVYLVVLRKDDGKETYAIFLLRDDSRDTEVAVHVPTATWRAYNDWGGESLYSSTHGLSGGKARKVSLDRPISPTRGFGSGHFLSQGEHLTVMWLEDHGYDVEYLSSLDVGSAGGRIGNPLLYVSIGHNEYATMAELDRLSAAVAAGTSLALLTGNTMYWQVRYEDNDRVMVCYKDRIEEDPMRLIDPRLVSTRFRDVDRPENEVVGVMSDGNAVVTPVDWVVTSADHWVYAGTGLGNGARLPGLVGFEWDGLVANGRTPAGITVLASSEVLPGSRHEATIYERGRAFVFAAGTIFFSRGLAAQPAVERMMQNLLARAGATSYQP